MVNLVLISQRVRGSVRLAAVAVLAGALAATGCAPRSAADVAAADTQQWRTLFDGDDLGQWRGYRRPTAPAGWRVEDGTLAFVPGGERGDLVSREQFGDFELQYEWKISEGGNSGVIYRASEAERTPWMTGPEMQILDDLRHPDVKAGRDRNRTAGSLYDLIGTPAGVVRPAGEWNQARIVARGGHLEHWLNDQKVVDIDVGSDRWNQLYEASKFREMARFGREPQGHIVLQDHGDRVWYRNIQVRPLD